MPSTVIRAFDYQPQTQRLTIAFISGRIYVYDTVPGDVADEFRRAQSKGVFFNAYIRDRYPYREVTRAAGERAA